MSKIKYDIKKVPRELLEEYIMKETTVIDQHLDCVPSDIHIRIRKAAEVPVRTKAEVNADIAKAVRDYLDFTTGGKLEYGVTKHFDSWLPPFYGKHILFNEYVTKLVQEETSD